MLLARRPTCVAQYTVHPQIVRKVLRYAQQSIIHTIFCGPHGSGKYSLALLLIAQHTGVPLAALQRVHPRAFTHNDKEYTFYKSPHHFEIDVAHFQSHQQKAIVEIVCDLSKTMNVALLNHYNYKIIVLRNSEYLTRSIQHQLRRIVETLYRTARLIFTCGNIDNLDATIRSRFLTLYVPAPSVEAAVAIMRSVSKEGEENGGHDYVEGEDGEDERSNKDCGRAKGDKDVEDDDRGGDDHHDDRGDHDDDRGDHDDDRGDHDDDRGDHDDDRGDDDNDNEDDDRADEKVDDKDYHDDCDNDEDDTAQLAAIVTECNHDLYRCVLQHQMLKCHFPNQLTIIVDTLWAHITSKKNCTMVVRKMLRDITITQVPWNDVLYAILSKVYTALHKYPAAIDVALRTCCYYTYLHELSHRKEIQLELLVLGLHELLRRKRLTTYMHDWL